MYVERGGDGRERYYDPMNYIGGMMSGGGWPMTWKSPQDWTTRDYDRLGDIMTEWLNRQRGRQNGSWGPNYAAPWMMGGGDNFRVPSPGGRSSQHGTPWGPDMARMMERVEEMAESYKAHLRDLNDKLYGSEEDRREERWRDRQFKLWREFQQMAMNGNMSGMNGNTGGMNGMPAAAMNMQMPGMMNQNAAMQGMPGMAPGIGMGFGNMMPQQFGAMNGMPNGMGGTCGGMGMAGAMPGAMPGPGMGQLGRYGDDMYGGGGGFGPRRGRPFRRRGLGLEDDFDDDLDGGGRFSGGRGMFGRRGRRDDDGIFGGFGDGE